jgi:putative ABC transport system ATP-binding protein
MPPDRASPSREACVAVDDLRFAYRGASDFSLHVPKLRLPRGESTVFIGPSGSGKTTLLHLLAGILVPTSGRIVVEGREVTGRTDAERRRIRISSIGIIFQEFELLEHLTVRENILLPYHINRALSLDDAAEARADALARSLGIAPYLTRRPKRLAQGERQRTAICRALVTAPAVVMADEPTGNLDPDNTRGMLDLVFREIGERDATFLMVTHDHSLLDAFDEVIDFTAFGEGAAS